MTGGMYTNSGKLPRCCSHFLLLTNVRVYGLQLLLEGSINGQVRKFTLLLSVMNLLTHSFDYLPSSLELSYSSFGFSISHQTLAKIEVSCAVSDIGIGGSQVGVGSR
jgi:hypothetical protein